MIHRTPALRRETRTLLGLAAPVAMTEFGVVGMSVVDTVMVGHLGAGPLAGLGFGSALQFVVLGLLGGTLAGVIPLVARADGAGDAPGAARLLTANLWLGAALAVPGVAALLLGGAAARLMGQPAVVSGGAAAYLSALALGLPPTLFFVAGRAGLEGHSRPRAATAMMLGGVAINAVFAALLVPRYGLVGAGLATSATRWLMGFAMFFWLRRQRLIVDRGAAPAWVVPDARRIASLGAPIGAQYALELGVFAVAAIFAGWIGVPTLAAWQVAINAVQTVFVIGLALGSAGAIQLGQALGAHDRRRARDVVLATFRVAIVAGGVCGLVFALAPRAVGRLYTADRVVLDAAVPMFALAALFTVVDQLQVCALTLLHGAADTTAAALIAVGCYWIIGIPLAWWGSTHLAHGASGVWLGLCAGSACASVAAVWRLQRHIAPATSGLEQPAGQLPLARAD